MGVLLPGAPNFVTLFANNLNLKRRNLIKIPQVSTN